MLSGKDFRRRSGTVFDRDDRLCRRCFPGSELRRDRRDIYEQCRERPRVRKIYRADSSVETRLDDHCHDRTRMGIEVTADWSASAVFRTLADAVPAYTGLRYRRSRTNRIRPAKYEIRSDILPADTLRRCELRSRKWVQARKLMKRLGSVINCIG